MAQPTQFFFTYQEVVAALIREQGIHEGHWRLLIEFGFSATNVNTAPEVAPHLSPAAINLVKRIGLMQTEEMTNLVVDASKVNPKLTKSRRRTKVA